MAWLAPKWGIPKVMRTPKRCQVSSLIEIPYMYKEIFLKVYFAMTKGWGDLERLWRNREGVLPRMNIKASFSHENLQNHSCRSSSPSHRRRNWVPYRQITSKVWAKVIVAFALSTGSCHFNNRCLKHPVEHLKHLRAQISSFTQKTSIFERLTASKEVSNICKYGFLCFRYK